jgi:hypothetical protein
MKRLGQRHGVGLASVEQVAGKKDYVGIQARGQPHNSPAETWSMHVAQVHIAYNQCCSPAPGIRQSGQLHLDAPDADKTRVH